MKRKDYLKIILIVVIVFCGIFITYQKKIPISHTVSQDDIKKAEETIRLFFTSVNNNDVDSANSTLGRYRHGHFNKDNIGKWKPQIISIEYPGKILKHNLQPSSYKSNYGKDPYQSISFDVRFKDEDGEHSYGFILVKEDKNSPWSIHDWGQ